MATHDHTGNADEITPQARTLTRRRAFSLPLGWRYPSSTALSMGPAHCPYRHPDGPAHRSVIMPEHQAPRGRERVRTLPLEARGPEVSPDLRAVRLVRLSAMVLGTHRARAVCGALSIHIRPQSGAAVDQKGSTWRPRSRRFTLNGPSAAFRRKSSPHRERSRSARSADTDQIEIALDRRLACDGAKKGAATRAALEVGGECEGSSLRLLSGEPCRRR
jgi:hypothetical protein